MKPRSWLIVLVLLILHQDYWNWNDDTLWLGFLPSQLGYHIIVSLLTAGFWLWLTKYDWPLDEPAQDKPISNAGDSA